MRFLKRLFRSFIKSSREISGDGGKESSLPLARFLTQSNHFNRGKSVVKQAAFNPPPSLRLSVFRIDGLNSKSVVQLSSKHILGKTLYGWAKLTEKNVQKNGLSLDLNEDPERHADIVGWPEDKDRRKIIALELANASTLMLMV